MVFGLQPGRVEDRGVVGLPELLELVLGRRHVAASPAGRRPAPRRPRWPQPSGRQDRPAHGGEPPHEEGRGLLEHPVGRLEPGDVGLAARSSSTCRKRTKAFILWLARLTFLARSMRVGDVGVGDDRASGRARPAAARAAGRAGRTGPASDAGSPPAPDRRRPWARRRRRSAAGVGRRARRTGPPAPPPDPEARLVRRARPACRNARAAARQPSKSVSCASVATRIRTGSAAPASAPAPAGRAGRRVGQPARRPVQRGDEGPHLVDAPAQARDVLQPQASASGGPR